MQAGRAVCRLRIEDLEHPLDRRGGTEWPAAVRPAKSLISSRSPRASPAIPLSNPRSRSAAASAARCAWIAGDRSRRGHPPGPRRMASAHARAPRRRRACRLARRPRRGLSARRPDGRRPARGRRRITGSKRRKPRRGNRGFRRLTIEQGTCDRSPDAWQTARGQRHSHPGALYRQIIGSAHAAGCQAGAGLRLEKHGGGLCLNFIPGIAGLLRPVARPPDVRGRTARPAPCSRCRSPARGVFSRSGQAARS
jgi:hypothetical protein